MSVGFVQIDRDWLDYVDGDPPLLSISMKLHRWQQWKDGVREFGGRKFALIRGQVITTERALQRATGIKSRSVVRRCLDTLSTLGLIKVTPAKEGTLITLKGGRPADTAADPGGSHPFPVSLQIQSSNHPQANHLGDEPLEPHGIHGCPEPEKTTDRTTDQTRPNTQDTNTQEPYLSNAGARGTDGNSPLPLPIDDAELAVLEYGQGTMRRCFTARETDMFLAHWRSAGPWATADELQRRFAWVASHPKAALDTKSPVRIFYLSKAQATYRDWDDKIRAILVEQMQWGDDADACEYLVGRLPSCDAPVVRAYAQRIMAELRLHDARRCR